MTCKISICFSPIYDWKDWITSYFMNKGAYVHNYNKIDVIPFWEHKHNVINRIPLEELEDLRKDIYEHFKDSDINFLLICNKSLDFKANSIQ